MLRNKIKINYRIFFFFLTTAILFGFETGQNIWIYCFVFFRSFLCLTCNHTMMPAIKLVHIILKYKFFQIIILCLWHWGFFAYINKYGIILYLKVVIHHLPDSFHLGIWISSSAVTIIFFLWRMFSEEKRCCLLSALRFATWSMVSQSSVNWAINC